MRIVLAGATGFLGRPLAAALQQDGHDLVVLTRHPGPTADALPGIRAVQWTPDGTTAAWASQIDGADAVVNLAGESIAGRRWNAAHKTRIRESRIQATASLVAAILEARRPPSVLMSGSASGYYGPCGGEVVTEETPPGQDFLAEVCRAWEAEAHNAANARTRVVSLRTGIVLERDGGALPQMLPPFWFGVGGPIGSGRQFWPWIHRQDWVDLVRFALRTPEATGPFNLAAPEPAANRDFARALGRALHRPSFMPAPGFALKLILGEMAEALLLSGQRMVPAKADALGFRFTYPRLDGALHAIFG